MKEKCKQEILTAYAISSGYMRRWAINALCMRYGTEYVAECIVELGLDNEDL